MRSSGEDKPTSQWANKQFRFEIRIEFLDWFIIQRATAQPAGNLGLQWHKLSLYMLQVFE